MKKETIISEEIQVNNLRKITEIRNLKQAFTVQIPSTLICKVYRSRYGPRDSSTFFSDSILDLLCFALSRQKKKFPKINSKAIDDKSYLLLDKINLGIAMDNGSNLKVLSINSADEKSLEEIQDSITNLLELYDSGKTIPSEFFESSIIVTDLSGQGIEFTVPKLSSGQAIILSLGRDIESNYYISCTYDHRVMEGFYVSNFLNSLRDEINRLLEWTCERSPSIACHACEKTIEEELGLDSSNRGLIIMKTANDNEILLCHNCFEGF